MEANTYHYYEAAKRLGLPVQREDIFWGFSIKLGGKKYFFRFAMTPFNCGASNFVAENKFCVNRLLSRAKLPVPKALAIERNTFKKPITLGDLSFPLVLKPLLQKGHGTDVICAIPNEETLYLHIERLFKHHEHLLIEAFIDDMTDYRVLVFYGKTIGLIKRIPAFVIGDGISNILTLMKQKNLIREEINRTTELELGPLEMTPDYEMYFKKHDITLRDIPKKGKRVPLAYVSNATFGGEFEGLSIDHISNSHQAVLKEAAKVLNLNLVGFDIKARDLSSSNAYPDLYIIEANVTPDVVIHEHPMSGNKEFVCEEILKKLIFRHPCSYHIQRYFGKMRLNYNLVNNPKNF